MIMVQIKVSLSKFSINFMYYVIIAVCIIEAAGLIGFLVWFISEFIRQQELDGPDNSFF